MYIALILKVNNQFLKHGLFENKFLIGSFILGTILQIGVVIIPKLAEIFKLVPLTPIQWLYTIAISIAPIIIIEIQKKINELKFGKKVPLNISACETK